MNSGINVEHDVNIHLENKGVSRRFFIYSVICKKFQKVKAKTHSYEKFSTL